MQQAHARTQADHATRAVETRVLDLTELDDLAYERFMQELLADLAHQRNTARAWRLPAVVMPEPVHAVAAAH